MKEQQPLQYRGDCFAYVINIVRIEPGNIYATRIYHVDLELFLQARYLSLVDAEKRKHTALSRDKIEAVIIETRR